MNKPEIWAVEYLSKKALKHFHYETNILTTFYITDPSLSKNWKELLNKLKNLSVIASKRKEISRKNMLNFKLIKLPVSQNYEKSPDICGLINNFTVTSVLFSYAAFSFD